MLAFGNVNASQQLYSGDVVLIPLEDTEINQQFFYKNSLITTVIENKKPHLLFGIPYDSSFGTNSFDTFLDLNVMKQYQETIQEDVDYQAMLESIDDPNDPCNKSNMGTYSLNVTEQDTGCPDDDYDIDI